jgi:type IV pilus assembly protein PilA
MMCPSCRTNNAPGAATCSGCGLPLASGPAADARKGMAITALVLGILSFPLVCAFGAGLLTALIGLILGIVALVRANRNPETYGGKGMAIAGLITSGVVLLMVPIWAAIAIPSLLRARMSANDSSALGDVRTVISAEVTYASSNGGYYDTLACLANPRSCIPNLEAGTPVLLDAQLASPDAKAGYKRELHLGAAAPSDEAGRISPSSAVSFAYVAVPVQPGRTGIRAFCGDENGIIRVAPNGLVPAIIDGKCPESLAVLN